MNPHSWARTLLLALPLTILTACTSAPRIDDSQTTTRTSIAQVDIESLLAAATRAREPRRSQLYLQAAEKLTKGNPERAKDLLDMINWNSLNNQELDHYKLLNAQANLTTNQPATTRQWLDAIQRNLLPSKLQLEYDMLRAQLADIEGRYQDAIVSWGQVINQPAPAPETYTNLWLSLLKEDSETLTELQAKNSNAALQPWLELAIIYRSPTELSQQLSELEIWQQRWQGTAAWQNMPASITTLQTTPPYQPKRIALLLPLSGPQSPAGTAVRDGFLAGYYQALNNQNGSTSTLPELALYDTETGNPAILARQAQDEGAELIIGPLRRSTAGQALKNLDQNENRVTVPWLVLNQVTSHQFDTPVYQFGLASENEAILAAERAWQDGYRNPIIMSPDSTWGTRVATSFSEHWEQLGGKILSQHSFNNQGDYNTAASEALLVNSSFKRANNLTRTLGQRLDYTPRRREDADMIFMVGSPTQGRQLKPALDFYFAYNLPVYTVSNMYSGQVDPVQDRDLNNIRIPLMPWFTSHSPLKNTIRQNWRESSSRLAPLYALGADAWRIYPRLEQMTQSEGAQLFGATGILTIPPNREVQRELSWQYFRNGRPTPLTREISIHPERNQNVLENES